MKPSVVDLQDELEGSQVFKFGTQEVTLDIFKTCQDIIDIEKRREQFPSEGISILEEVVKLMEGAGFKNVTQVAALRFLKAIKELTMHIKKNIESDVLFQPSTASTPST